MKALLDESAPERLVRALAAEGCRVFRFPHEWKGLKDGALLQRLKDDGFGCLITSDKNLRHQQTISGSGVALVVLPYQRFADIEPLCSVIAQAVKAVKPGQVAVVQPDSQIMVI